MADNKHAGSSLDSFLEEEGLFAEFEKTAIEEVSAWLSEVSPRPSSNISPVDADDSAEEAL